MIHAREDYTERVQDSAGKIPADEPVLLIRGQDAAALYAVDAWLEATYRIGKNTGVDTSDVRRSVTTQRERIAEWQRTVRSKVADLPGA